ncbi:MAG: hypothetical protein JWN94_4506 [Betaproteobacteria bacterium]|nr:hypothetical protein [Betaproteobacteria bacterium]
MKIPRKLIIGTAALVIAAGCAPLPYAPIKLSSGLMTGNNGMTLYTFDKDARATGRSECSGQCATNWPPLIAGDSDNSGGDWSVITRDDGRRQWAWLGKPLYYWSKDQKPGDTTGDNFNQTWHAVRPEPRDISAGNMNGP